MAAGSHGANVEEIHAADAHHVGGGHDHEHATGHDHADAGAAGHGESHDGDALGPIDWRAWGAGVLGAVAAGVVAVALYLASHPG